MTRISKPRVRKFCFPIIIRNVSFFFVAPYTCRDFNLVYCIAFLAELVSILESSVSLRPSFIYNKYESTPYLTLPTTYLAVYSTGHWSNTKGL